MLNKSENQLLSNHSVRHNVHCCSRYCEHPPMNTISLSSFSLGKIGKDENRVRKKERGGGGICQEDNEWLQ